MELSDNFNIDDVSNLEIYASHLLRAGRPYVEYVQSSPESGWLCNDNGKLRLCRTLSIAGRQIQPRHGLSRLIASGVISSPATADDSHSLDDLFEAVRDWLATLVAFECDYHYTAAAAYVVITWFDFLYDALPYLRFLGDFGSGKTTALRAMSQLCYRAFAISGVVNPAPLFRIIQGAKGTLAIDEADLRTGEVARLLTKILNHGYTRGISVIRLSSRRETEVFDPFGPKLIAARREFSDEALESRFLTVRMKSRKDSLVPLSDSDTMKRAALIRNGLLFWRMNYSCVKTGLSLFRHGSAVVRDGYEPRLAQIAKPLFDCTPASRQRELDQFFEVLNVRMVEMRAGGLEAYLKGIIRRANEIGTYTLHFNQIYMSLSPNLRRLYSKRHVSRVLEILGCERRHGRDGTYVTWSSDALA